RVAMKRALSGRGRRGSPPLPRQRAALRVVQATLLMVSTAMALFAARAWGAYRRPFSARIDDWGEATSSAGLGEVALLALGAVLAVALALAMGIRAVRGPEPPKLD
ncbi:MAG: hypothetical protein ACRDIF_00615, partial [Actinomycetota bacterium]